MPPPKRPFSEVAEELAKDLEDAAASGHTSEPLVLREWRHCTSPEEFVGWIRTYTREPTIFLVSHVGVSGDRFRYTVWSIDGAMPVVASGERDSIAEAMRAADDEADDRGWELLDGIPEEVQAACSSNEKVERER
ncbi:MAG: hypothetical protein ACHREM_04795 [Polyangiales bacterium]